MAQTMSKHDLNSRFAAFVDLVEGALRASNLAPLIDLDEASLLLRRESAGRLAGAPLALAPLQRHLCERGLDKREANDVLLFVHDRAKRFSYETELPDDLQALPPAVRESRVDDFARGFAMAMVLGVDERSSPVWVDETPVVDLLSLQSSDPTKRHASLLVMTGARVGEVHRLTRAVTVLGRATEADLTLDDHGISRRHCEIRLEGQNLVLRDLESKNGLFVNGLGVDEHVLEDGDRITIGSALILKFMLQDDVDERFQEKLLESLTMDPTTGAYNRRFFVHRLRVECAYARRHQQPLALLFFDLDEFKRINDTYGHPAGDFVLAEVVKVLKDGLRMEDIVSRYGGEELTVILRGTAGERAVFVAERLRRSIEEHAFVHEERRIPVTTSVGVATLLLDTRDTPQELIQAADEALYKAKSGGRNQVVSAD